MSRQCFKSLESQLMAALETGDIERICDLMAAGADPFKPVALSDLSADVRRRVEQALARRAPPGGEKE